ncbi:MAG TPA: ATP-dependent DNA helicase RecG [Patescibacteria group bacterium]|jgi:ATP-dependent DNA helicase RecG|nr:ATP-dependent DNA helicase RecG [Patescibacteria group bacterium]
MNLQTNLSSIKGVGPKTAAQFEAAGLETVGDLIRFLPRKHEDFSEVIPIAEVKPGKNTIRARCESTQIKRVRRGMTVTSATLVDDSGKLQAVWFNQPYRATQFQPSDEYYFSGDFEFRYNRYQLTNPSAEKVSDLPVQTDRILPIYRQIKGLKSQVVRKILAELRPLVSVLPETLPPAIVAAEKLMSYAEALTGLHFPTQPADIARARERLGFEELFQLLLASQLNRQENAALEGIPMPFDVQSVKKFVSELPFTLTNAQRIAAWEIIQDFEKAVPMNRLLQGDVGSGKTVVAGIAALEAAQAGYQTALMAPTEILARQHAQTLSTLLEPFGITVGLLIGSVKGKARQQLNDNIARGAVAVVVGTHALIQDSVTFHSLGFVAIDEQHRFGVAQRQALLSKADHMPHLLSMTATPIPRSLQLTVFGELDVSVLNERPANRKPIKTTIVSPISAKTVYAQIDAELSKGRQAYVICSLIDESVASDKKSVEAEYKKLKNSIFGHRSIGMLHGRMKPEEKDQVMQDFKAKKYDLLVSTTVVEVGVDVPNATCILIENADQFGLAQLHQLRGRVGRGEDQSYCFLMMSDSKKPSERLREVERSNDGFYLAEVDLRLRGPGEIYGRAQHGELNLQIASLADTVLIKRAQQAVERFMDTSDDLLQYKQLAAAVAKYQRLTTLN